MLQAASLGQAWPHQLHSMRAEAMQTHQRARRNGRASSTCSSRWLGSRPGVVQGPPSLSLCGCSTTHREPSHMGLRRRHSPNRLAKGLSAISSNRLGWCRALGRRTGNSQGVPSQQWGLFLDTDQHVPVSCTSHWTEEKQTWVTEPGSDRAQFTPHPWYPVPSSLGPTRHCTGTQLPVSMEVEGVDG